MIVHQYSDGSKGFEYETGDQVSINDVIAYGKWLRSCVGKVGTVERVDTYRASWVTAKLEVRYSPEWGPAECFPWMIKPTAETKITKTIIVDDTSVPSTDGKSL